MRSHLKKILLLSLFTSCAAYGQQQIGKTYAVKEESALDEISTKARNFNGIGEYDVKASSAFKGYPLPFNKVNTDRMVAPFYTLEFDITDRNGNIIYPKGFIYNVAEYVSLPFRVVVFSESQVNYIRNILNDDDIALLTEGDIFKVQQSLGAKVFYLDKLLAERLYVQGVPSIVEQIGSQYKIMELVHNDI